MDTSEGTSFEDVARYSCDAGYALNGAAERTCQADGEWNGTEPTCESEILESSNQANVCACHYMHSQCMCCLVHAVYACLGTYVVLLLAMSFAVGVSCGHPGILRFGRVDTSAGISIGDVARYSCDAGYTLNGAAERTCHADGQWNGTEPTCEGETL